MGLRQHLFCFVCLFPCRACWTWWLMKRSSSRSIYSWTLRNAAKNLLFCAVNCSAPPLRYKIKLKICFSPLRNNNNNKKSRVPKYWIETECLIKRHLDSLDSWISLKWTFLFRRHLQFWLWFWEFQVFSLVNTGVPQITNSFGLLWVVYL